MIQLNNISFYYQKDKIILNNLSLTIKPNSFNVIMGQNGSGKSTLLMIIKGILKVTNGHFSFKPNNRGIIPQRMIPLGILPKRIRPKAPINKKIKYNGFIRDIGFVFQDPDIQIIGLDVVSDLQFGPLNLGWDDDKVQRNVEKAMVECDIKHLQYMNPFLLSYGEKKRVAIAGILAMDPLVLMLDEPTTWLDPWHKNQLKDILVNQNTLGKTIILTTHDMEFAKSLNCNYIFIENGSVLAQGGIEVFHNTELLKQCRLL